MITIKFIPNIMSEKGRKEIRLPFTGARSVFEYLEESKLDITGMKVIQSGLKLDYLSVPVDDGDELIVTPDVRASLVVTAAMFAITSSGWTFVAQLAAIVAVSALAKWYSDSQRRPVTTGASGFESSSPTYSWDGIANTQDVGLPVPIIYGEHKVGGNIVNMSMQNYVQYEYEYDATPTITNLTHTNYVNTFSISETINYVCVRFQNYGSDTSLYNYRLECKLHSGSTWTVLNNRTSYIPINFAWSRESGHVLDPGIYDFRITLLDRDSFYDEHVYYSTITTKAYGPSTKQADNHELNMLLALCEGEIESIDGIEVNNNPIGNYPGIEIYRRYGTNDQTVIPAFSDLEDVVSVGVQLSQNAAYTYTTTKTDMTAFKLAFAFPSGIYQIDSKGSEISWVVSYKVAYRTAGVGDYVELGTFSISAQQRSNVTKMFRKDGLTAGQYDIQVTKTTADSDATHAGDMYLQSVIEINYDDMAYPNTALLGVKAIATEQVSGGTPNVTAIVRGKKVSVPQIMYDGAEVDWEDYYYDTENSQYKRFSDDAVCTWDGATYVSRWSANPIWCVKDLMLNARYGLGEYIAAADIDDAAFLAMSQHCEEKVLDGDAGYEKRYRLDIVIDGAGTALDLLNTICNTFNAFAFYTGGKIAVCIDKAATPVQLFGMGNIVKDSFGQSWTSLKDIPNAVEVQFLNKEQDYVQETITVADETALAAGDPLRKKSVRLFVTKPSYAFRAGRFILNCGQNITRSAAIRVGIDAIACQAGDIVSVAHDVPQWGVSGRVGTGSTTTSIVLDRTVTVAAATSYVLRVRFADDTTEERAVTSAAGSYTTLTTAAFSQAPAAYAVYSFGTATTVKKDWRIMSMQRDNANEVTLGLTEYSATVYDDTDFVLPQPSSSMLSFNIPLISTVTLTEHCAKMADGTIADVIDVWFEKPTMTGYDVRAYSKARIYLSDDTGTSWQLQGETNGTHFAISNNITDGNTYVVAVTSVDDRGRESGIDVSPQSTIIVQGKMIPPNNVAGFSAAQDGDDIMFTWAPNTDVDLYGYEIRQGDTWATGSVVATDITSNSYRAPVNEFGAKEYMIKAIDSSGNYSVTEATKTITVAAAISIKDVGIDDVDSWDDGTFENYSGAQGFEVLESLGTDPVTDSAGNPITDNTNAVVTSEQYVDPFLSLICTDGVYAAGGTYISAAQDLGSTLRVRINPAINYEGDYCTYAIYISTSTDGSTYSDFALCSQGEYICRYYKIKVTLVNENTAYSGRIRSLKSMVTARYRREGAADVSVTSGGLAVTFSTTFYAEVRLNVVAPGAQYVRITNKSLTGFTATVYNDSNNAAAAGTIDWTAEGY